MYDVIKKPLVTEKSSFLSGERKYVFIVRPDATKPEVKKAIKSIYKVDPVDVNIVNRPSKRKRVGSVRGRQPGYKKAIVTLKEGQKIDIA
ncbi:MAG: 50S ribosomal protein L23 [Patescibacteria group bacterium]